MPPHANMHTKTMQEFCWSERKEVNKRIPELLGLLGELL